MVRNIFTFLVAFMLGTVAFAQTGGVLKGKVIDKASGETIPFATVVLKQGAAVIGSTQTDLDGEYTIKPIPPGNYTVEASYVGYSTQMITNLRIAADKTTYQNFGVSQGVELSKAVEITEYRVPLIDPDTKSGGTVDRQKFNAMATKNINSVASTTAGVFQADEGAELNVRGSRGSGGTGAESSTDVYIDGERVRGSSNIPQQSVEQISIITGGLPAQYGDATGGVINITTRGPQSQFFGGVEAISSQATDAYGYNFLGWSFGGPILSKKDTVSGISRPILGFVTGGEITTEKDPEPSAIGIYKIKDSVLTAIEKNPLIVNPTGGASKAAELVTMDDMEKIKARQNVRANNIRLNGKVDFSPVKDLNFTVGGNVDYSNKRDFVYNYSLFNPQNNQQSIDNTWRVWGRVTQKLNLGNTSGDEKSASLISNAYYTIQAGYQRSSSINQDAQYGDDYFKYGYIGKFDIYKTKTYSAVDANSDGVPDYAELTGYQDTLVTFTRSEINSLGANYTSNYFDYIRPRPFTLDLVALEGGQRNGDRLNQNNIYSLWNNTGRRLGGYGKSENSQFRAFANFNMDIKNHAIQFGFEYEQRDDRSWSISAAPLWTIMRLSTNTHLSLDKTNPVYNEELSGTLPVYDYNYVSDGAAQTNFDRNLREKLGLDPNGTEFLNIDAMDPSTFNINMFSPDELLTSFGSLVGYYGYDIYGNKTKGSRSFDDFFTKKNDKDQYTREVGSFRPIYMAGYIQDKFDFRDLKFNIGLRVDRFDANQPALKDIFSIYDTKKAGELDIADRPSNIGDDFVPYVSDPTNPSVSSIVGYRDPKTGAFPKWYNTEGVEVTDPATLSSSGRVYPYLVDPTKSQNPTRDMSSAGFQDYKPQLNMMPRIAFSFPISDVANFFAHYDVLTQRPPGALRNDPFSYYNILNDIGGVLNNPGLKPEKTTDYELGFSQILNEQKSAALTITAFYRELRDMIQIVRLNQAYPIQYQTYGNIDFGTVKGLSATFDLRRVGNVSMNFSYTLSFADGTGSSATSGYSLINSGNPNLRSTIPLDYDQRHQVVGNFDFRYDEGAAYNGPVLFGKQIFSNSGFNITARAGSGTPYSAQTNITPNNLIGVQGNNPILKGSINGNRKPWQIRFDMRVDKNLKVAIGKKNEEGVRTKKNLNVYLQVLNLLNTKNVMNVYGATGDATDDGYINSSFGQLDASSKLNPQSYVDLYSVKLANPGNFSIPRRIRIGLSLDF